MSEKLSASTENNAERRLTVEEVDRSLIRGAAILKYLREVLGMSQKEAAHVLLTSQPNISKLEQRDDVELGKIVSLLKSRGGEVKLVASVGERVLGQPP